MPLSLSSVTLGCPHFIKNTASYTLEAPLKAFHVFKTALKIVNNCVIQKIQASYFYASTKGYQQFRDNIKLVSALCAIYGMEIGAVIGSAQAIAIGMVAGGLVAVAGTALATVGFQAMQGVFKNSTDVEIDTWAQNEINRNPQNTRNIRLAADKIRQAYQTRQIELNLSHHDLTTLPTKIWQLTQLRTLDLSRNRLESLSPEIRQLTQLRNLDLSFNRLETLPATIGQQANLQILDARNNQLHILPAEIASLNHLQLLLLHNNPIPFLPQTIVDMMQIPGRITLRVSLRDIPGIANFIESKHNQLLELRSDVHIQQLIHHVLDELQPYPPNPELIRNRAIQHNALINQLLNHAARSNDQPTREAGVRLRTQYNNIPIIREVIDAAEYAYDEEDDLIWVSQTGNHALLVKQDFYNKNILHIADPNNYAGRLAEWNHYSSIVRNEEGRFAIQEADQTGDIQQILNPFPLLSNAYRQANRLLMLHSYLNTLAPNIPEGEAFEALDTEQQELLIRYPGYIQRFKEALLVDCYPNADQEKRLVQPSDQSALWQMLANTFVVPVREVIGQDDMLNEAHFASIITALGLNRATADAQASHLFVLAAIFTKYSSAAIFGKEYQGENISPGALRRYAVGLLNKAHQLAPDVIHRIDIYKRDLIRGACSNILFGDMKSDMRGLFNDNPTLRSAFETLMPIAWR